MTNEQRPRRLWTGIDSLGGATLTIAPYSCIARLEDMSVFLANHAFSWSWASWAAAKI